MIRATLLSVLFLFSASQALASAKVNIENKANINSNSNSNNNANFNTDIRVETNGKVTEYHSNEPGKIEVKAENGVAEIKKDGQVVQGTATNNTDQATATPKPTEKDENEDENEDKEEEKENETTKQENKTIISRFFDLIKSIFALLR